MLYIGSHTSFNKDTQLIGVVNEALSYGSNVFMFYTGSNQSTLRFPIDSNLTKEAHELMIKNNIDKFKCMVHAPFIINLANNTVESKYNFYISFLKQEINRCISLGINNLVLHPGSRVTIDREKAIENIAFGINKALEGIENFNILLEFMSGKGSEVGSSVSDLSEILSKIIKKEQVFVCLDTCHMNDSGIDLTKFDLFLDEFDKIIGINKIKCIHINDSYNEVGAKKDRHANIGYGSIGFNTLIDIIYNNRLSDIPKILETPYLDKGLTSASAPYKTEIEMIRNKNFIDFINL